MLSFFDTHGMLGFRRKRGGRSSAARSAYVEALLERSRARLHLGLPVRAVARRDGGVEVRTADGEARRFDGVVLAVHGDQALPLLADPDDDERRVLSRLPLDRERDRAAHRRAAAPARAVRGHRGTIASPTARRRTATRRSRTTSTASRASRRDEHYCVTLNRTDEIDESRVIRRIAYEHPLYTFESLRGAARAAGAEPRATAFAGAWQGVGFHEDGLVSGPSRAAAFGVEW